MLKQKSCILLKGNGLIAACPLCHGLVDDMNLVLRHLKAEEQKCQWNWHNWKDQSVSSTESDSYMSSLGTFLLVRGINVGMEGERQGFLCEEYLRSKQKSEIRNDKTPI